MEEQRKAIKYLPQWQWHIFFLESETSPFRPTSAQGKTQNMFGEKKHGALLLESFMQE